jgi:Laminin B (Domain IV)
MKKRNIYFFIVIVIILILLFLLLKCRQNNVYSYFDNNDDGWKVTGDVKNAFAKPDYHSAGGNPGGFISATDETTGGVWYWNAPKKFLGSKGGALNKKLSFDLMQSDLNNQFEAPDIILESKEFNLVYKLPSHPDVKWTSYSVSLSAEAGWKKNDLSGQPATGDELKKVLSRLVNLRIRGEYITGPDVGSLDNVCLFLK